MSGRLSHFENLYQRMVLILCLAACRTLTAGEGSSRASVPIEVSTPKADALVTNLNQLRGETRLESDSEPDSVTPNVFSPRVNSLRGIMPLPPPSRGTTMPSRRIREWMDQRKNWAFQTPEEVVRDIAMRDFMNVPGSGLEDQETQPSSSVERFYEEMWRKRTGTSASQKNRLFESLKTPDENKNSLSLENTRTLSGILNRPQSSLKDLLSSDLNSQLSSSDSGASQLLEAFGLTANNEQDNEWDPQRRAETTREKQQLKQFQELLNGVGSIQPAEPGKSVSAANPWSAGGAAIAPVPNPLNPFATVPGATVNPALLSPSAPLLPVPSSLAPVPFASAPERTPPPRPTFAFPQRAF